MLEVKKKDLQHLSTDELRKFYTVESYDLLSSPIKEYIEAGKKNYTMSKRWNYIELLINSIVIERFIKGTL